MPQIGSNWRQRREDRLFHSIPEIMLCERTLYLDASSYPAKILHWHADSWIDRPCIGYVVTPWSYPPRTAVVLPGICVFALTSDENIEALMLESVYGFFSSKKFWAWHGAVSRYVCLDHDFLRLPQCSSFATQTLAVTRLNSLF
ncbi:uncharacterized protein ARMOST_06089 [Armillaria ostoyae]|uniref:Uncharacterized protein n=1 Tax=Armillaria ostoyae TaxID=47428 RepID=A0A284R213_ARMOS|nr:uncharacterized protein ARMOST_06089 [Armillaria ostoyae]